MTQNATLPTYGAIYAFGDSLSDAGNLSIVSTASGSAEPVSPPYYKEQYGTITGNVFSNGPTWVQDLSISLGLGILAPSLAGGTDFAYGGADTGPTPQNANDPEVQKISLPSQIVQFQTAVLSPSANALYTLSIGSNDLLNILGDIGLTAQQQAIDVSGAVANEISFVKQLVAEGARNLLVLDVPDLGKAPSITQGLVNGSDAPSAALGQEASHLAREYNSDLRRQLATIASTGRLDVHMVDAYQLVDDAVADPEAYGLTNVTSPVWSGNYTSSSSGVLATTSAMVQDQYLFWDHLHPTETGHLAIAAEAEEQLSHITIDNLNIAAGVVNRFIHRSAGHHPLGGTNVLDSGLGTNLLGGVSFVGHRGAADFWSTGIDFHASDGAMNAGVMPSDFALSWQTDRGTAGNIGLPLHSTTTGAPTPALTFAGYISAPLSDDQPAIGYGASSGNPHMYRHVSG
ncbi:MAG: SGNH/GDSL hydrolase family protein [Acetobacteraceae bacterium]